MVNTSSAKFPSLELPKLTNANLAILMEQPSSQLSAQTVEQFVGEQSRILYPLRAPSLSPMVASQDRILAEQAQQTFVTTGGQQCPRTDSLPLATTQSIVSLPNVPRIATSMRNKAGKSPPPRAHPPLSQRISRDQQDHTDRLKKRKEARRQKRLIVQDRSRSFSSRVRDRQCLSKSSNGKANKLTGINQSSRNQRSKRMLDLSAVKGYKPMARMTSERMTMVSRCCAGSRIETEDEC